MIICRIRVIFIFFFNFVFFFFSIQFKQNKNFVHQNAQPRREHSTLPLIKKLVRMHAVLDVLHGRHHPGGNSVHSHRAHRVYSRRGPGDPTHFSPFRSGVLSALVRNEIMNFIEEPLWTDVKIFGEVDPRVRGSLSSEQFLVKMAFSPDELDAPFLRTFKFCAPRFADGGRPPPSSFKFLPRVCPTPWLEMKSNDFFQPNTNKILFSN